MARLSKKLTEVLNLYRSEMKILKQEQKLLDERKDAAFQRFLDRSDAAYEDFSVWTLISQKINEVKILWHDLESERPGSALKSDEWNLANDILEQNLLEECRSSEESRDQAGRRTDKREGKDDRGKTT